MDVTDLVTAASRVLSEQFGKEVCLRAHETLSSGEGNFIMRLRSLRPIDEKTPSFVVKAGLKTVPHAQEMLWNDWAALEFLGRLQLNPPVCPRLFGGDSTIPFIVMEDLGANSVQPA